jgi:hypothetical protein
VKELLWIGQRQEVLTPQPYVAATGTTPASGGGGNDIFNFSGYQDPNTLVVYDPFWSTELQLNGHSRTLDHHAVYYRTVQPWQFHTAIPNSFIYVYSFALFPEDSKQPSGSCNLYVKNKLTDTVGPQITNTNLTLHPNSSRIDNVTLRFTFPTSLTAESTAQAQSWTGQIRVYALSMNVIKITSGMVRSNLSLLDFLHSPLTNFALFLQRQIGGFDVWCATPLIFNYVFHCVLLTPYFSF